MRKTFLAAAVSLFVAACSDEGPGPTSPLQPGSTTQFSSVGGDPATVDPCGGFSPCDAYPEYDHGEVGPPGFCFLPPMVDNHLSHPACSGTLVSGLSGLFELAWCEVRYATNPDGSLDPSVPPTMAAPLNCETEGPLTENGGFYSASVHFRKRDEGKIYRLYVVGGGMDFAFRDVIVDPNLTTPADAFVHAIGTGNEPVKVRVMQWEECHYFDTQEGEPDNAAICLVSGLGGEEFTFQTDDVQITVTYQGGNVPHLASIEASECLSLGFFEDADGAVTGNALVDIPLADCKIDLNSEQVSILDPPALVDIEVQDPDWLTGPYANARLNVVRANNDGQRTVGQTTDPGWWGTVTASNPIRRWIDGGLDRLAWLLGPEPLLAWPGNVYNLRGYTDIQIGVPGYLEHVMAGTDCVTPHPSCLRVAGVAAGQSMPVSIKVEAPARVGGAAIPVPGARVHLFPQTGSVACPAVDPPGQQCYEDTEADMSTFPPLASEWDHLVVLSGDDGTIVVDWTLEAGENELLLSSCGNARPGPNEPDPGDWPVDGVWGELADCSDRSAALGNPDAFDNGPRDGLTPYEPVDPNEVAMYGLPLTIEATACGQIDVDGEKGAGEWDCIEPVGFIVPLKGKKAASDNAWLRTHSDGEVLYISLEVLSNELGNKIFINLVDQLSGGSLGPAANDDVLVLEFPDGSGPGDPMDWHYTVACVNNSSSSLCGAPDTPPDDGFDAAASATGADGHVFYELARPYPANPAEDLDPVPGVDVGLRLTVTQGQGGGKGGFVIPDPQSSDGYVEITLN